MCVLFYRSFKSTEMSVLVKKVTPDFFFHIHQKYVSVIMELRLMYETERNTKEQERNRQSEAVIETEKRELRERKREC